MAYENDEKVRARAMRAELGESSNGNVQIGIEFALLDTGARMTWYGTFTEKADKFTLKGMRAAGWTGLDVSDLGSLDASMTETPEVELVIGDDDLYNGQVRRKIKFINRGGGLAMKAPLQGDALKVFAAKMRAKVAAFDHASGQPVGGGSATPKATVSDDGPQPTPPFDPNEQPPLEPDLPF